MAPRPTSAAWRRARVPELRRINDMMRDEVGRWIVPNATNIFDESIPSKWRPREVSELPENNAEALWHLITTMAEISLAANAIEQEARQRLQLVEMGRAE